MTYERAAELFEYDPQSGVLRAKVSRGSRCLAGAEVGTARPDGYLSCEVDCRPYLVHRVCWLLAHGDWPSGDIDHVNGVKDDNRLANLRGASRSQNTANSRRRKDHSTGFKGVSRMRRRYRAVIRKEGKQRHLGCFDTPEGAYAAYCKAAADLHGEFANNG